MLPFWLTALACAGLSAFCVYLRRTGRAPVGTAVMAAVFGALALLCVLLVGMFHALLRV